MIAGFATLVGGGIFLASIAVSTIWEKPFVYFCASAILADFVIVALPVYVGMRDAVKKHLYPC